jgi:membrane protein YqaA with SNARE-associated domain
VSAGLFFAALSGAVVSSLVPFVNAELLLLGLALAAPAAAPMLAVVVAVGQMAGKSALFLGARRVSESALAARLERWRLNGRGRVAGGPLVGLSALTGLPPFYLLSIAAPALGVRFRTFLVMGLAGRLLRFGALVLLPGFLSRVVRLGGL